ncbi:unnamed protein product [Rhizoctonia solani]|uniref:Uncharacterized protein n=1 Tax=Rhizoctonia solani TaxID=456999 RepID=A0A8H3GLC8_9AGAM|nr:unnamed protein product [Rhizoctonia solani]
MADIFLRPPTCPSLEAWEAAGTELANSMKHYMNLSQRLFATAMWENMHPIILAERIDRSLDFMHRMLDRQLALSRSMLARARNTLMSPAYVLPDEVFAEIFMNVLYPADKSTLGNSMDSRLRTIFPTLFSLMRVSRVWWDVILRRSEFWSLLPLYIGSHLRCLRAPALGSRRARGPLHLAAVVHKDGHLSHWAVGRSLVDIRRIRTMNISTTDQPVEGAMFREFGMHDPGSLGLRELSLHRTQTFLDQNMIPGGMDLAMPIESPFWTSFLKILKLLSVFRVSGAEFRWNQMTFSDRLVELRLQRVIIGHDSTLADFLRKLVSSPALRDLKIISVKTFSDEPATDQRVLLPNLDSLLLEDISYNTLRTVLRTISPGSHRLTLFPTHKSKQVVSLGNPEPETINSEQLNEIMEAVPVDTMLLAGQMQEDDDLQPADEMWLTASELHGLLASMPALKTLKANTWVFAKEDWQAMTRTENSRFPRLENLHFSCAFLEDEEFLKPFVTSHHIQRMTLEGSLSSVEDGVPDYEPLEGGEEIISWLKAKIPDFTLEVRDPEEENRREPLEFCSHVWRLW